MFEGIIENGRQDGDVDGALSCSWDGSLYGVTKHTSFDDAHRNGNVLFVLFCKQLASSTALKTAG